MAVLLTACTAQAFAVYNHFDKPCALYKSTWRSVFIAVIQPGGHYNGAHGSGLDNAWVICCQLGEDYCWMTNDNFGIHNGGYIRIYETEVKVYNHDGSDDGKYGMSKSKFSWDDSCSNYLEEEGTGRKPAMR